MEQRIDYIAQTTPQSPRRVILPGKKAMYRVRDGAKRAKMFRGQGNEYVAGSEYTAAMGKTTDFQMLNMLNLAFSLVDAAEEVARLREQLNAAEALIEELDHDKAVG